MPNTTLYFIGLGLNDENDISIKGMEAINNCTKVYAEFYTSKMMGMKINSLEELIEKKIIILSREETEKADVIIESAKKENVAFLTGGDSMMATTHVDMRIRAIKNNISTELIHGTSIITAVPGLLGLQQYKFGRTTTLVLPEENYFPTSPYDAIKNNKKIGLHTLVLLDIQADKNRYMTATEGLNLLLKMEEIRNEKIISKDTIACVIAQAGSEKPIVKADKIINLIKQDFGPPLHTIVIPGELHFMEIEALQTFGNLPE
jgi:diphthine synthase